MVVKKCKKKAKGLGIAMTVPPTLAIFLTLTKNAVMPIIMV
jgi:hypothetical protein